ncbi:hypothetical protein F6P93_12680 [Escherichia coli]|nr:hypothetical protein F6P93_12680 [Escherichia coli]
MKSQKLLRDRLKLFLMIVAPAGHGGCISFGAVVKIFYQAWTGTIEVKSVKMIRRIFNDEAFT